MYGQSNHGRRVVGDEVVVGGEGSGGGEGGGGANANFRLLEANSGNDDLTYINL